MSERETKISKDFALSEIVKHVRKGEDDVYGDAHEDNISVADMFTKLAKDLGASDYEITEAWFTGHKADGRQGLFEVHCEKFWWDKDFKSFEDLREWTDKMIKIRDKFHLEDPLVQEAETPEVKTRDLKLSESFINEKDKQGLFDLLSIKLKNDESFASLGDLKEWADEMLEIKTKYDLNDPLKHTKESTIGFYFPKIAPTLDPNEDQRN